MIAVYVIRQISSGIVYVGSSVNVAVRWNRHRSDLNRGRHHAPWLQRAWTKRGECDFFFEVIETLTSSEQLRFAERWWMTQFDRTFNNMRPSDAKGILRHGDETRAKMSNAQKARFAIERSNGDGRILSREHIALMLQRRRETVGWVVSADTRAKMSAAAKARCTSEQMRAKGAIGRSRREYGPLSAQQKAKLSLAHTGKKLSLEHRAAIAASVRKARGS